jgi:hypothetical protein
VNLTMGSIFAVVGFSQVGGVYPVSFEIVVVFVFEV